MKFVVAFVCGLSFVFQTQIIKADQPNILFVYADDWGWGDLSCHGHEAIKTPNIDRLAKEGADFHQFTVGNPVCSPSRATILTGHYPARHRIHQHFASHKQNVERGMPDWLDPQLELLPKLFKKAGYRTGHFGKWHLSSSNIDGAPMPKAYGYDEAATYVGPGKHVFSGLNLFNKMELRGSAHHEVAASFLTTAAVEHTLKFIRNAGDKPFYINLWIHETHHLVSATEEDKKAYPDTKEPERTYYSAVTRADKQIGRVLSLIDELGKMNDTLVVFSSDNGPENTHPNPGDKFYYSVGTTGGLRGRKRSLYNGGVGTPFIVRWPGHIPAGRVDKTSVITGVDMFPTLLKVAGINTPEGYVGDGMNILPIFKGKTLVRKKPIFWEWRGNHSQGETWPMLGMRDDHWSLLMSESGTRIELYNLKTDRAQSKNLAAANPDRVKEMISKIREWKVTLPKTEPQKETPAMARRKLKKPKIDRKPIFLKKDTNKDGELSLEEYLHKFPDQKEGKRRFPKFDKNNDGVLSEAEFVFPNGK